MNGILVVNKPPDHTSHDVVARLRGILRQKRIGHGGTLDPMAVGVLPVLVGQATRASAYLLGDKEYVAEAVFGFATDSQDITGAVSARSDKRPSRMELERALEGFRGPLLQQPPMVSAVKVGGKKLVDLHRSGVEVERAPRTVTVYSLNLEDFSAQGCTLRAYVSKGTYIRTLVHDIGMALGCYATLSALCRTKSEPYDLKQSHTLDDITGAAKLGLVHELLLPLDSLFCEHPAVTVSGRAELLCRNGNSFPSPFPSALCPPPGGLCRVYGESGDFLMLGRVEKTPDGATQIHPQKVFSPS